MLTLSHFLGQIFLTVGGEGGQVRFPLVVQVLTALLSFVSASSVLTLTSSARTHLTHSMLVASHSIESAAFLNLISFFHTILHSQQLSSRLEQQDYRLCVN